MSPENSAVTLFCPHPTLVALGRQIRWRHNRNFLEGGVHIVPGPGDLAKNNHWPFHPSQVINTRGLPIEQGGTAEFVSDTWEPQVEQ